MGRQSLVVTLYLALVCGSIICTAHNTFSMLGKNRWKAGGKRSDQSTGLPQHNFLDASQFGDEQPAENAITLREMLVDMRDYCNFLLQLLDNVRLTQTERK